MRFTLATIVLLPLAVSAATLPSDPFTRRALLRARQPPVEENMNACASNDPQTSPKEDDIAAARKYAIEGWFSKDNKYCHKGFTWNGGWSKAMCATCGTAYISINNDGSETVDYCMELEDFEEALDSFGAGGISCIENIEDKMQVMLTSVKAVHDECPNKCPS